MIHELKIWPAPFEETRIGVKRTEVRADGPATGQARFNGGDVLRLREYDPQVGIYTGRWLYVRVMRLQRVWEAPEAWGFRGAGLAVMEIDVIEWHENTP